MDPFGFVALTRHRAASAVVVGCDHAAVRRRRRRLAAKIYDDAVSSPSAHLTLRVSTWYAQRAHIDRVGITFGMLAVSD